MPEKTKTSPEWTTENVIKQLEEKTPPGGTAAAQVFLADSVPAEAVQEAAKQVVQSAVEITGDVGTSQIGKIHRLAKSFSIEAPPAVLREITKSDQVKTILPSKIESGVLIEPVKKVPVP